MSEMEVEDISPALVGLDVSNSVNRLEHEHDNLEAQFERRITRESMHIHLKEKEDEELRRTIYRMRGQAIDGEDPETNLKSIQKFIYWLSILVLTPSFFGFVLLAIPVLDINELDPEVRRKSMAYNWCSHAWISIVHSFATWYLVQFYVISPVFDTTLKFHHKAKITVCCIFGGVSGYWIAYAVIQETPLPFSWFWALNCTTAALIAASFYVIFKDFLADSPGVLQETVIERILILARGCCIGLVSIFTYIFYYVGYQRVSKAGNKNYILAYTLVLFAIKEVTLKTYEWMHDTYEKTGQPLGQFWALCLHSYFMTMVLSADSSMAQIAILFILDWFSVFWAIFKICFALKKVEAEKEAERQQQLDAEKGLSEEAKGPKNPRRSVKSVTETIRNTVNIKSKAILDTLSHIHQKADLGQDDELTDELVADGQLTIKASYAILCEFIEFYIPCTYFVLMYSCSYLPNFKYILSVTSDEFGFNKVENLDNMWNSIGIIIMIEFSSFCIVALTCRYAYGIRLFPVLLDVLQKYGLFALGLSMSSFFAFFGVVYEPWANDLTFKFQYLENQKNSTLIL